MATMTADALIALSKQENRTVTEYPDTLAEEEALLGDLLAADGDTDSVDMSGNGYCGAEERGYVDVWGPTWRVHVVHAEVQS